MLHPDLLQQLEMRASREGRSVDDVLKHLLDLPPVTPATNLHEFLFQHISKLVLVCAADGRLVDCNPAAVERLGYDRDALLKLNALDIVRPEDKDYFRRLGASESLLTDVMLMCKDGSTFPVEVKTHRITYAGQPAIAAVARDVTEQKATQSALQESEARFRQVVENMHEVFWLQDADTRKILYVSPSYEQVWGRTCQSLTDNTDSFLESIHPDDLGRVQSTMVPMRQNGIFDDVYRIVLPDRTVHWIHARSYPVWDAAGRLHRIAGVAEDITEQRRIEDALRATEQRERSLNETQSTYVVRTDMAGNYTYVNPAFVRKFGWKAGGQSFIGTSSLNTIFPDDHGKAYETVSLCLQQPNVPVQVVLRKDFPGDKFFWTLWEFTALTGQTGQVVEFQCVGIDITELILVREQLQLQEQALYVAANAVVITDREGVIEWVNPAFATVTGYTLEEVQGKHIRFLKSGRQDKAFYTNLWDTILSGESWHGRLVNKRKDGSLYTEEQTITPVRDDTGAIKNFIAIKQDVTELEQSEQLRLEQERLKVSLKKEQEQIALIQRIISTLSHDLRTSLTVISTSRDTITRYYHKLTDERRLEKLHTIGNQTRFALELLEETVMMARGNQDQMRFRPRPLNLSVLCEVTVAEIQETTGARHHLRFITDGLITTAHLDETLVSRVLLNLLSNAVKFSPEGSEIRLELSRAEESICLKVTDQGLGIDVLDLEHIFEPFYRSDSVQTIRGTGLGLSIVRDCVERHNGHIRVESQLGSGTTFTVTLPLVAAE
jgi:PAS domain S-box-containing protein